MDAALSPARFDLANRLFFRLYQSSNQLHKIGTRSVSAFGCTTQQWAVMGALSRPQARERGVTVKELIEFLAVSRQNLTPLLDRLEDRGWVERVRDADDGRSRRIRMTVLGEEVWAEMLVPIDAFYRDSLSVFSDEERLVFYRLLDRLKDRFDEM